MSTSIDLQCQPSSCEFCERLWNLDDAAKREWYDFHILSETEDFVVIPTIGSIVPGYLLIVTKLHVPSMARLDKEARQKLIEFSNHLSLMQERIWEKPLIFEHGAFNDENTAGSCINHAHWHLVPGPFNLMPNNFNFKMVDTFETFAEHSQSAGEYLFFQNQSGTAYIAEVQRAPGQLFRRELARAVNKESDWDYVASPFYSNIRETIHQWKVNHQTQKL